MQIASEELEWYDHGGHMMQLPSEQLRTANIGQNISIIYGSRRSGKTTRLLECIHNDILHIQDHSLNRLPFYIYCHYYNTQLIIEMYGRLYGCDLNRYVVFLSHIHQLESCNMNSYIYIDDCECQMEHWNDIHTLRRFINLRVTTSDIHYSEYLMNMLQRNAFNRTSHIQDSERYILMINAHFNESNHYPIDMNTELRNTLSEYTEEPEMNEEDGYQYRLGI